MFHFILRPTLCAVVIKQRVCNYACVCLDTSIACLACLAMLELEIVTVTTCWKLLKKYFVKR